MGRKQSEEPVPLREVEPQRTLHLLQSIARRLQSHGLPPPVFTLPDALRTLHRSWRAPIEQMHRLRNNVPVP